MAEDELFSEFIGLLEQLKRENIPVIVEGKKDKAALEALGLKNILVIKKPLYAVVELVAGMSGRCAILTDLDKEGKLLYSKLKKDLQMHGVCVDDKLRNWLFKNTKVRQVEGLAGLAEKLKNKKAF